VASIANSPPPATVSPETVAGDRIAFNQEFHGGQGAQALNRPTFRSAIMMTWPVSPFVVAHVSGTTRNTPTGRDCLAATTLRSARSSRYEFPRLLLRPHSQTSEFLESPPRPNGGTGNHPGI
jgi:hypothetical protein